jgi:ABC-type amino acid transport substrate-binding protein
VNAGVSRDGWEDLLYQRNGGETRLADFDTHEDGLAALEDRRIDAYIADQVLLLSLARRGRSVLAGDRRSPVYR